MLLGVVFEADTRLRDIQASNVNKRENDRRIQRLLTVGFPFFFFWQKDSCFNNSGTASQLVEDQYPQMSLMIDEVQRDRALIWRNRTEILGQIDTIEQDSMRNDQAVEDPRRPRDRIRTLSCSRVPIISELRHGFFRSGFLSMLFLTNL